MSLNTKTYTQSRDYDQCGEAYYPEFSSADDSSPHFFSRTSTGEPLKFKRVHWRGIGRIISKQEQERSKSGTSRNI